MEPTIDDFDKYLSGFVESSETLTLLLDFDGTLAPIVPHPDMAKMSLDTEKSLTAIASNPRIFTAIISGRAVESAKERVGLNGIIYAGNHGLEILYPNGTRYNHQIPENVSGNYDKMIASLEKITREGAWIENKGVSLTFHYRAMSEDQQEAINNEAREIIESFGYRANQAHCAIEAKPPVLWNKGKAAEYILTQNFGANWRESIKVVFAGDDTTDEDVFDLLIGTGVTFRVTKDATLETKATHKIPSTESITKLLQWVERKYK